MNIKSALQRDLDRFFKALSDSEYTVRGASKGGFSTARKKLDPWAFQRLNDVAIAHFYREAPL